MRKILITGLAAAIGFAGWTDLADAELFSATRPVIAILGADLYVGVAEGHLSGAGTLAIHSQIDPDVTCFGKFTSSAVLDGAGQLRCSDRATATFHFQRLSVFRGYGGGSFSRGAMSFTYGLTADESEPYLTLPPGKKLRHNGEKLQLVDL
jgi:hypothetical protein